MENITFWEGFASFWFATWLMCILRTWKYIKYNLEHYAPRNEMNYRPYLHFLVYSVSINVLLPIVGMPITLSDNYREKWVNSYVGAIIKRNEKRRK